MTTKAVPIQMEAEAHHDLRLMAAAAGKSMGGLIWLMVKVLRRRLENCHLKYGIQSSYTSTDAQIINFIIANDLGQISDDEFDQKMRKIRDQKGAEFKQEQPIRPGGGMKIREGKEVSSKIQTAVIE